MNDFSGLLAPDFGYKSQSKSAPMSSSKPSSRGPTRSPWNAAPDYFDSLFSSSSDGRGAPSSLINFDSIFGGSSGSGSKQCRCLFTISRLYDYDIFDGVPGLNTSGSVNYDVFSTDPEPKRSGNVEDVGSGFDDLLHGFGRISPPSLELIVLNEDFIAWNKGVFENVVAHKAYVLD
uniref:Uncharacterized protein n=1 Tax=Vitis vinifera TaxID=29760 RepID=A5C823_VITVI|nr:hypothetical protein VITISV_043134 [Vitis vinifera]